MLYPHTGPSSTKLWVFLSALPGWGCDRLGSPWGRPQVLDARTYDEGWYWVSAVSEAFGKVPNEAQLHDQGE